MKAKAPKKFPKTLGRLLWAAGLSATCYGVTWYWYNSTAKKSKDDGNQKPIAYVSRTKDEISRRPVTRLLWSQVSDGDPLYPGEALRTSSIGEARIEFAEGQRSIDIEPDSLIVINKSENEILLDLMDGSVTVSQGNNKNENAAISNELALTLNSGGGKVDLSKATASLSKSGQGIDLQVLKGKAQVRGANGQTSEVESGKRGTLGGQGQNFQQEQLVILSPTEGKTLFVNDEALNPVQFSWKGFPANTQIAFQIGSNRKDLKTKGETESNKYLFDLKPGRYYWKLIAKDKATQKNIIESSIYKLEITARRPAVQLSPENKSQLIHPGTSTNVTFHWAKPEQVQLITLEVWKDSGLQNRIVYKAYASDAGTTIPLEDGDYYWRLSAQFETGNTTPQIKSPVQSFKVIAAEKVAPKVFIGWVLPEEKNPQYFVDKPQVQLSWTSEQRQFVKLWRLKFATSLEELNTANAKIIETTDVTIKSLVERPGRYIASVEALDQNKNVIANSPLKNFEVAPLPLLASPLFEPQTGDLQADNQGHLNLKWNSVEGAKEYNLVLLDKSGKEIRSAKFTKNSTALVNLLPGKYQVIVAAIDQYGRKGKQELARNVTVPDTSGLGAPKLKQVKVNK